MELFILVGEDRIELVPQRTSFEGAKRRAKCSESRMQEVYMTVEKKGKGKKKASRREAHDAFIMVGDNRIELLTFCL